MEKDVEKSYYERVKNYVALKPESTKVQVSAYTGIPIDFIEDGIASGKFDEYNGYLRISRKNGMNPQRRNELARKFVSQLHCDVKPISVGNKSDSKLVEDLKKRYGDNYNSKNDRYL